MKYLNSIWGHLNEDDGGDSMELEGNVENLIKETFELAKEKGIPPISSKEERNIFRKMDNKYDSYEEFDSTTFTDIPFSFFKRIMLPLINSGDLNADLSDFFETYVELSNKGSKFPLLQKYSNSFYEEMQKQFKISENQMKYYNERFSNIQGELDKIGSKLSANCVKEVNKEEASKISEIVISEIKEHMGISDNKKIRDYFVSLEKDREELFSEIEKFLNFVFSKIKEGTEVKTELRTISKDNPDKKAATEVESLTDKACFYSTIVITQKHSINSYSFKLDPATFKKGDVIVRLVSLIDIQKALRKLALYYLYRPSSELHDMGVPELGGDYFKGEGHKESYDVLKKSGYIDMYENKSLKYIFSTILA